MHDPIAPLLGLLILVAVLPVAVAHILGGGGWSGWVMRLYGRILRFLFSLPFVLLGRAFGAIGKAIKSGK
ncbi:hypothetical protein EPO33_03575 [Patescibacteria group bacterium]|nr:MAG: hypothetical protein EPO33_03575 [Patescibacteria group bacterium]